MSADDKPKAAGSATPKAIDVGPLADMVGYNLRRAQIAVFDEIIRVFGEVDLRPAQFSVLLLLGHTPGLKQTDVAGALGIQRANFVVLFDGLERRGLARRDPMPNDRRSYALFLTPAGEEVLAHARRLHAGFQAHLDARLGPGERQQLLKLLRRLQVHEQ